MKYISTVVALLTAGLLLAACGPVVVRPVQPQASPSPTVTVEDEGAPPAEYIVEGAPVYYEAEPGIAFYPMFVDFPGSCFCIMPVRFYGGVWYAPGRVVVHSGHWTFHRPGPTHLHAWRGNGGHFRGHAPIRGHIERGPSGRMRAVAPPGIHHRPSAVQQHRPQPHAAPQHQQQHRPQAQQPHRAPQAQPQHRPQPQARPAPQRPQPQARPSPQQRAPAKAPAKRCGGQGQPRC